MFIQFQHKQNCASDLHNYINKDVEHAAFAH